VQNKDDEIEVKSFSKAQLLISGVGGRNGHMSKAVFVVFVAGFIFLFFTLPSSGQLAHLSDSSAMSNWGIGFGARSMGMGGAFIAIADDIAAISHNPAGLSQLRKPEFSLGCSYGGQNVKVPEAFYEYDWYDPAAHISHTWSPYTIKFGSPSLDYAGAVIPFEIARIPVVLGFAYQKKFADTADYSFNYAIDTVASTGESVHQDITQDVALKGGTHAFVFSFSARPFGFLHIGFNVNSWRNKSESHNSQRVVNEYYFNGIWQNTTESINQVDPKLPLEIFLPGI
jgi:hypothetical protein